MSKIIILKEEKIIDDKTYRKGEVITVDDDFPTEEIKEVIKDVPDIKEDNG